MKDEIFKEKEKPPQGSNSPSKNQKEGVLAKKKQPFFFEKLEYMHHN